MKYGIREEWLRTGEVTPLAGVWIEIYEKPKILCRRSASLPLRECGLKYISVNYGESFEMVTPLAGVWIEILGEKNYIVTTMSLPLRECGLKY